MTRTFQNRRKWPKPDLIRH